MKTRSGKSFAAVATLALLFGDVSPMGRHAQAQVRRPVRPKCRPGTRLMRIKGQVRCWTRRQIQQEMLRQRQQAARLRAMRRPGMGPGVRRGLPSRYRGKMVRRGKPARRTVRSVRPQRWRRPSLLKAMKRRKARGLAAALRTRPTLQTKSTIRGNLRLGVLVPVREVLADLEKRSASPTKISESMPGDNLGHQHKQWMKDHAEWEKARRALKPGEQPPPEPPEPGVLSGESLDLFECRYNGRRDACCKVEGIKPCKGTFPSLAEDLKEYVRYMHDRVAGLREFPPKKKSEFLHLYGCKRLSRLMPGFAKVVKIRISNDLNMVKNWTEEISPTALQEMSKPPGESKPNSGPPPYKPPTRDEIVEICTVTHQQLALTLRRDLEAIVGAVTVGRVNTKDDLIAPVSVDLLPKPVLPGPPIRIKTPMRKIAQARGGRRAPAGPKAVRRRAPAKRPAPARRPPPAKPRARSKRPQPHPYHRPFNCKQHRTRHTIHQHCTQLCGGNRGHQGPCYAGCVKNARIPRASRAPAPTSRSKLAEAKRWNPLGGSTRRSAQLPCRGAKQATKLSQMVSPLWEVKKALAASLKFLEGALESIRAGQANTEFVDLLNNELVQAVMRLGIPPQAKADWIGAFKQLGQAAAEEARKPSGKLAQLFDGWSKKIGSGLPPHAAGPLRAAFNSLTQKAKQNAKKARDATEALFRKMAAEAAKKVAEVLSVARRVNAKLTRDWNKKSKSPPAEKPLWLTEVEEASKQVAAAPRAGSDKGLELLGETTSRMRGAFEAARQALLWIGLGDYRSDLKGERFRDIADRLLTFYRKAGGARAFEEAQRESQKEILKLASKVQSSPAGRSPEAVRSVSHQASKKTVETRAKRETLRRRVAQWTYGYEYEQLGGFLKSPQAPRSLLSDYRRVEQEILTGFWKDCMDIQEICQQPKTTREKASCIACAKKAVSRHCIDGKKGEGCRGFHRAVLPYRGVVSSGTAEKKGGGKSELVAKLNAKLEQYKHCFVEEGWWRSWFTNERYIGVNAYAKLKEFANAGDWSNFQKYFQMWFLRDCFSCNCGQGGGPGCRGHPGIRPYWHTKHVHCTMDCGGNSGFQGVCYETCKAGHDIGRWADQLFRKIFGGLQQESQRSLDLVVMENHELRVGDEPANVKPIQGVVVHKQVRVGDGRNSFLNWLALQVIADATNIHFHGGTGVTRDDGGYEKNVLRNVVNRTFLPKEENEEKGINHRGMQYLNSLPLTAWQRCYLVNPSLRGADECRNAKPMEDFAGEGTDWRNAPLFQMVLPMVRSYIDQYRAYWQFLCAKEGTRQEFFLFVPIPGTKKPAFADCRQIEKEKWVITHSYFVGKDKDAKDATKQLQGAGDAVADMAGPIVGKLLGILLKAAGIYELMKSLAKAAGLTPEQSTDCEDSEYRRDVMKLPKSQDHKRGCLLKVFAKNFTNILESIVKMVASKLVDWGVDMLRNVLQVLKSALVTAAGSVPFAGGFLAGLVDIAWELLMNHVAKMLLKMLVVEQLPKWLQIDKLAQLPFEKLLENPVVQVIAGIIIFLIDSAMTHGDRSWMAVGADTLVSGVQFALRQVKPTPFFWLRALHYAKKEMRKSGGGAEEDLGQQLGRLVQNIIEGFKQAIARGIGDPTTRQNFEDAADKVKQAVKAPEAFVKQLIAGDPIAKLSKLIGGTIGPIVIAIVTNFVKMDPWVKRLLYGISNNLVDVVKMIEEKNVPSAKELITRVVDLLEPQNASCSERVLCRLIDKLPVSDPDLREMLKKGVTGLASALRNVDDLKNVLNKPTKILEGVVGIAGDYLAKKAAALVPQHLKPERALLQSAVGKILKVVGDEAFRKRLFAGGPASQQLLMKEIATIVKPYAMARLGELAADSGLKGLVESGVEGLFGENGPFYKGAAFFDRLGATLRQNAPKIAGEVFGAVAGIVDSAAKELGAGPILGGIAQGVLGALRKALSAPGGLKALFAQGAASVLGFAKSAFSPLLAAIVPSGGSKAAGLGSLIKNVLGGALDLIGNPNALKALVAQGASALKGLAAKVATGLRDAVKSVVAQKGALPEGLRQLAERAIDGFFRLLSDPSQLAKVQGTKVLDLLKEVGSAIFTFLKDKVVGAVAGATGQSAKTIEAIARSVVTEVGQILANPSRLRAMVEGKAREVIAFATGALSQGVQALVKSAVPSEARAVIGRVVGEVLGFLGNPSRLGSLAQMKPGDLLAKLAPVVKDLLEQLLRSAVPAGMVEKVKAAIATVRAALANPAGLVAQAGAAARKAIDEVLAAAVMRISDEGLRGLASSLIALVRDLVATGAPAQGLRTQLGALLGRLVATGKQYLLSLLPSGPTQQLVGAAIAGLRDLVSNPRGVATALALEAKSLLPGIWRTLAGFLQNAIRDAFGDRRTSALVGGLVEEILGLVGDPKRWKGLLEGGVARLLARFIPVVRDFAFSTLAQVVREAGPLRGVVEGLLNAAGRLFSAPKALANFAKNAVSSLVSMGIDAVAPVVLGAVERATGGAKVLGFVRTALDGLAGALRNPAKLAQFLQLEASKAFGQLLAHAEKLVTGLVDGVVKDKGLNELARGGLQGVLAFVRHAVGGGDLLPAVKSILAKLIPGVLGLVTSKLSKVLPPSLKGVAALVRGGFDKLSTLATDLVNKGKQAWTQLTSGGGTMFGGIVNAVLPLLLEPIKSAVRDESVSKLLSGIVEMVKTILADPRQLQNPTVAKKMVLEGLAKALRSFVQTAIVERVPKGIPQAVVRAITDAGLSLLEKPQRLADLLGQARGGKLVNWVVSGLKDVLEKAIGEMQGLPPFLKDLLKFGLGGVLAMVPGR